MTATAGAIATILVINAASKESGVAKLARSRSLWVNTQYGFGQNVGL